MSCACGAQLKSNILSPSKGQIDYGTFYLIADAEAGFGGPLNAFELMKSMIESGAAGVHFEDQLIDGTMRFDYKMQPGVVTHSNAIALMRAVGIEV